VFRLGRGTASRVVNIADKEKSYSHVGLLVKDSTEEWYVVHAVPGEGEETGGRETIKYDPIARFFGHDRTVDGVVMRFDSIAEISNQIIDKAQEFFRQQLLFDHDYSLSDSSTLYCTELVHRAFLCANIDLSEDRRHSFPLFKEFIIFPSDILQNKRLHEVCKITFVQK
jgi:hypothetical protein